MANLYDDMEAVRENQKNLRLVASGKVKLPDGVTLESLMEMAEGQKAKLDKVKIK